MEESKQPSSDPTLHRKHAAMMQRLSDLHHLRSSPKPNPNSSSTSSTFLSDFATTKLSVQSQISHLPNSQSPKPDIDAISVSISNLEQLLATSSYLLSPYELRSCLDSISDLKSDLTSVSATLLPKKKFSFKNKPKPQSNNPTMPLSENSNLGSESIKCYDSPGFKGRKDEVLVKDFRKNEVDVEVEVEVGEFVLVDLEGCEVRLIGCFRALFVHKLKNCRVYVGAVGGSCLIEEVEDCVFVLASHQIRIHHAKRCDFYLRVRSRPIIEDSHGVRFAPYCLRYDGIDEDLEKADLGEELGNWANVDDFKWLRAVQSPNWEVLPDCDRIGTLSISSLDGC